MNMRQEAKKDLDRFQNSLDKETIADSMKKRIQRGEEQIKNGQTKTKAEVDERFRQWLRSK